MWSTHVLNRYIFKANVPSHNQVGNHLMVPTLGHRTLCRCKDAMWSTLITCSGLSSFSTLSAHEKTDIANTSHCYCSAFQNISSLFTGFTGCRPRALVFGGRTRLFALCLVSYHTYRCCRFFTFTFLFVGSSSIDLKERPIIFSETMVNWVFCLVKMFRRHLKTRALCICHVKKKGTSITRSRTQGDRRKW